jgi:mucin-19
VQGVSKIHLKAKTLLGSGAGAAGSISSGGCDRKLRFPLQPILVSMKTLLNRITRIVLSLKGLLYGLTLLCGLTLAAALLRGPAPAFAAASLSITPITWNVIGLDSNNVNVGPNHFPVGVRVCNTGDAPATNVTSAFVWDSANPLVNLRPGTLTNFNVSPVPSLAPAACHDFYYEIEVTRNAAAYDTTRRYHITATADIIGSVSTPVPRELYVEHLISQSRNHVLDVKLNGTSVPSGGTMALVVGQTYTIDLVGSTATNGYEQIESFINFPNTIFQVLSVSTTYTADTSAYVGNPDDKLYGDGCKWENDPNSPYYRSCRDVGKAGGGVVVTYQVKILQTPGAPLVNPQPLSTLLYDFSGSSYHYNDDFGTSSRVAAVVDPSTLSLTKDFSPDPTNVNGVSALTFTITNPNPAAISGVSFSDVFPTAPGAMVVANPTGATINGCGAATFAPVAGAGSISFTNGTVAANSSCTVKVNVTVPATGTYTNTSNHLFVGGLDTGKFATDTLTVNSAPPPPTPVCSQTLAQWTFPAGFSVTSPAPTTDNVPGTPSAKPGDGITATSFTEGTNSWGSNGNITTGATLVFANEEYVEFAVDTSGYTGLQLSFDAARKNTPNSPQGIAVYAGTTSLTTDGTEGNGLAADPGTAVYAANATALPTGTTAFSSFGPLSLPNGTTHVRIYFFNSGNINSGSDAYVDNLTVTGCVTPNPPTISKSFSPSPVAVGGTSTLTFTVTNPNAGLALSGLAFDDTLPAGVTVTSGSSSQCGGTLSRTAPSTLSFTGGTLAVGASCTVTATVTVTTAGPHDNVSGFVSSTEGGTNTGPTGIATASITGILPPDLAKQFAPNPVLAGTATTLTFTLTNPNASLALSGVAFSDTFPVAPGAMVVAPTPAATTSGCGSPTFAPSAGSGSISFSGGTLAAGGTCIVTVDVVAPVAGSYANTSGPVSHLVNGVPVNGGTASDSLTTTPANPAIALLKQVGPTASGPWSSFLAAPVGGNVFYRLTVENIGNVPLSAVGVSDPQVSTAACSWPSPLPVAAAANDNHIATCVVGPIAAVSGTNPNTATASGTNGTTVTDTSTATYATTGLTLAKSVTETSFSTAGEVLHYSFLVTNSGFAALAGPVTVADDKASDESCPAVNTVGDLDNFLDPGESLTCTATYTVTAGDVVAGQVTNLASATADGITSNTDSKTVPLAGGISPPSIAKAFSPNPIAVGGVSTLTFTITNPNAGTALTGVAFTDTFPAGLEVATTPNVSTTGCGAPTFAPAMGNTSVSFSAGTIAASGTCTVTVNVTATTSGAKLNTTGNVASTNGGTGNTGTDTLTVLAAPSIAKAFSPNPIAVGGVSTLTFTITNSNAGTALTGVAFTDAFPAGLEVAATPNASTSGCGSPTFAPAAGNTSLSFSGGSVAASGTCTVSVSVTATTAGPKVNTTGNVTSTNGGTGNTGTDTLTVLSAPSIGKAFSPNPIAVGGISTLTFTITNPNAGTALTGLAFTDSFPAGLEVAATPNASATGCGSPTFTPAAGNTSVSFSGGTIAASGTCTVAVNVTGTTSGSKVNTTGNVSSTNGGTGNTGSDTLTVLAPPSIAKAFAPISIPVGGVSTMTFTLTNPNTGTALTGVGVTDAFPAGLQVAATPNVSTTGCGAPTFAPAAGNTSLSFSGATIAASGTCTVSVAVTANTSGAKVNTTGNVTSTNGGTGNTGTDTLTVLAPPNLTKAFSPNAIAVSGLSTLTFTITNPNAGTALTGVAFTDAFPAGLQVAATPNASTSGCGSPTFIPAAGNTSLSFSGGTIAASGTCTVSVAVTATTSGSKVNTTGSVTSTNGGTGNTGTDTLTVLAAPNLAKAFSPSLIAVGAVSTLTFTVTNPNAATALTGVAFTDTFPAGLQVAATPNATTTGCGSPTFAPAAGNTSLSFSGGTIAASGTCTVSVNVTATTSGAKLNTTGNVTSTNGGTGNTGTDTLTVLAAPSIAKAFSPNPIAVGGVSTLTFTITNPNAGTALSGVAFTDSFPAGLQVAATPNISTTGCGSPTFAPAGGNASLTFSGGTIGASGTCTVSVNVTATSSGAKVNTTGAVTSTNGGTGNTGTDTLTVLAPPSIAKAFSPNSVAVGGVSTLTFTLTNANAGTALTGVSFSDSFPAGLQVAATPNVATTGCGSPTFAPTAGNTSLSFSGGTIAASGTCTVSVNVTATSSGAKLNTTSNVTSTNGGTGNTGTDTLTVLAAPNIAKAFSPSPIAVGGVSTLTFTLTNPNAGTALTGIAFNDSFPAGLQVAATPNSSTSGCGSPTFAPTAGNTSLTFSGGTIGASGTCTVSVNVTATSSGAKVNTTGAVTSTNGGTGNTGTDTLTVLAPPNIAKAFSPNSIPVGGVSTMTFTITNANAGTALTGVAFTDSFPAGLQVAATPNASTTGCGAPTFAPAAGNTSLSFSGGTVAASSTCSVSVAVTATAAGTKVNTTGNITSTNGGTGNSGTDTLTVLAAPSIAKTFSPNPIAVGGVSTLTFTITNANAGTALTGVAFSDSFPAGLQIAATPNASTSGCGSPAFAPAAGNTSVSFSGGTIAANGTCTASVAITATTPGAKVNTTGNVTSTNGGTGNTGTDTLTVLAAPSIAKTFSPNVIAVGGVSTLTFTITNPNAGTALTGVGFTDSFPAGLQVSAMPNVSTTGCGSPTFTPAAGNTSVSFSGGTIAASGTCTVAVNVTGTTAGAKVNTTGQVSATNGGTGNTGTDTLTVLAPPNLAKAFAPNLIAVGGVSTLTFTITNPNAGTALTGVAFNDTFPAGLQVAATPNATSTGCGSPTFTPAAGNTSLSFSGGTIAASGTCTVSVAITAITAGAKVNTTDNVTSTNGGTGNTGTATLTAIAPPSIAKAFSPNQILVDGVSTLTFTLTNPNAGTALTGVAFSDTFPAGLQVAATPNVSTAGCGSPSFTPAAGDTSLSFSGGAIAANGTCTVSLKVTATSAGAKVNTTANVTSTNGGTGNTGTDTLTVLVLPSITKAFGATAIVLNGTTSLTLTLNNTNAMPLTGVAVTDNLPAGLVVATPNGLLNTCGGTVSAVAGSSLLSLTGGTLPASSSCTLKLNVKGTTPGTKNNQTGAVSANETGPGAPSNIASLTIHPFTVSITEPAVCLGPGGLVAVTATFSNGAPFAQSAVFTATLPTGFVPLIGSCSATAGACTVNPNTTPATVNVNVAALGAGQTVTVTYQGQVGDVLAGTQLCINSQAVFGGSTPLSVQACTTVNCPAVGPGAPHPSLAEVSDQKGGSVLVYNLYSSDSAAPTTQNTRMALTNTHPSLPVALHLFFVDGSTCAVADNLICLTANQTLSFLASDIDPGTTGYLIAVAVDRVTGCPINFNYLVGEEYVKLTSGHAANLAAESFAALAGGLPACDANAVTAVLNFDGVSYNRAPRALAASNLPSRADGNDTLIVLNRFGGSLVNGASALSNLFGILYDDAEKPLSFSFNPGICQFRSTLSNNFPRTTPRFEQVIPTGRSGWAKFYLVDEQGLLGAQLNFNRQAGTAVGAFNQGHNLHKLTLTPAAQLTIPIFPPNC